MGAKYHTACKHLPWFPAALLALTAKNEERPAVATAAAGDDGGGGSGSISEASQVAFHPPLDATCPSMYMRAHISFLYDIMHD